MPTPKQHPTPAARQAAYRARQAEARERERAEKGIPSAPAVATMPGTARWAALLEQARAALVTVQEEMQAYHDDRSEAWQEGERGAAMQEQIDALETVLADLEAVE
jgi:hypothetical protein